MNKKLKQGLSFLIYIVLIGGLYILLGSKAGSPLSLGSSIACFIVYVIGAIPYSIAVSMLLEEEDKYSSSLEGYYTADPSTLRITGLSHDTLTKACRLSKGHFEMILEKNDRERAGGIRAGGFHTFSCENNILYNDFLQQTIENINLSEELATLAQITITQCRKEIKLWMFYGKNFKEAIIERFEYDESDYSTSIRKAKEKVITLVLSNVTLDIKSEK